MSDNEQKSSYPLFTDDNISFWKFRKKNQWFCNKPLSPIYSSVEEKSNEFKELLPIYESASTKSFPEFIDTQVTKERFVDVTEKEQTDSSNSPFYDSDADPEYIPDTDISDSEIVENCNIKEVPLGNHINVSSCYGKYVDMTQNNRQSKKVPVEGKKFQILENVILKQRIDLAEETIIETSEELVEDAADAAIKENNTVKATNSTNKGKYKRKKDMCYFCEEDVHNFARHLERNHSCESEVQEIFSKGKKTKERRKLLALLKKKGNFIKNSEECVKPVKQARLANQPFLPCPKCLGFYRSRFLYRHRKLCMKTDSAKNSQAMGQNCLIKSIKKIDPRLREEVFNRMRADKISLEAKQDFLICAFGARYLKIHREKHFINVTSRKMRELARMLLEVKKIEPRVNNLFGALKPKYYDHFVEATKSVDKYDNTKDLFLSPTFALNICTSLKQCCDIALHMVAKTDPSVESANYEASLKTMRNLLESNWRFDISSRAGGDLNMKKFNKITIVPLASDLKLLKEYLIRKATEALKDLELNAHNVTSYNILLETIFCRVILLNRKRPGELQRMLVHTYENTERKTQTYEEFSEVVSDAEKILLKNMKRVVIRGKRGRGVPVMFSNEIQNHIKELLKFRPNFLNDDNPYLFGKPGSINPIYGYKIVAKYATACGAKNPEAITCTRLRKHLATLTQLFNLSENELEQLSTFMGHTPEVHKNSYRLPDDIYQTVKISKLLILMEKGEAGEHKGKTLDNIPIDLEQNLLNDEASTDDDNEDGNVNEIYIKEVNDEEKDQNKSQKVESNKPISISNVRGKKRILIPWTEEQKKCVKSFFSKHIKEHKPPKGLSVRN